MLNYNDLMDDYYLLKKNTIDSYIIPDPEIQLRTWDEELRDFEELLDKTKITTMKDVKTKTK
jgi:hypothetical protein